MGVREPLDWQRRDSGGRRDRVEGHGDDSPGGRLRDGLRQVPVGYPGTLQHGARRLRPACRRPPGAWPLVVEGEAGRHAGVDLPPDPAARQPLREPLRGLRRRARRPGGDPARPGGWRPRSRISRASSAARCRCRSSRSSVSRTSSSGSPTARRGCSSRTSENFSLASHRRSTVFPDLETVFTVDGGDGRRARLLAGAQARLRDATRLGPPAPRIRPCSSIPRAPPARRRGSSTRSASSSATSREWTSRTTTSARPGDRLWSPADWAWIGGLFDILMPAWYYGLPVIAAPAAGLRPGGGPSTSSPATGVRNTPPAAPPCSSSWPRCRAGGTA